MPKIEYVPKNFSADRLQMIEKVNGVVAEYQKQGYSLTLRQVYYQMVARDIIPNNMRSYKNLGNLINDARLAGLIDWLAIEDRTRNLRGNSHWTEPGKVIESAAYSYRRDHWEGQPNYVEVWVEKDALIGIVGQICGKLDVTTSHAAATSHSLKCGPLPEGCTAGRKQASASSFSTSEITIRAART